MYTHIHKNLYIQNATLIVMIRIYRRKNCIVILLFYHFIILKSINDHNNNVLWIKLKSKQINITNINILVELNEWMMNEEITNHIPKQNKIKQNNKKEKNWG